MQKQQSGSPSPKIWTIPQTRNIQSNCRVISLSHYNEITNHYVRVHTSPIHMTVRMATRLGIRKYVLNYINMVCHATFRFCLGQVIGHGTLDRSRMRIMGWGQDYFLP